MTEPFVPRRKFTKRKKRHVGEEWTGPSLEQLEASKNHEGIICRTCHKLIRWSKMDVKYERRGSSKTEHKDLFRLWFCKACGALLREDNLSAM